MKQLKNVLNIIKNMGWRYTQFRAKHELLRKTGLLKKKFPVSPSYKQYITLEDWKRNQVNFFFKSKEALFFKKNPSTVIKERFDKIKQGQFIFFNSIEFNIGKDYNWNTNPDTGFEYDIKKHWTEIADYSKDAGDIKYVWEKSRFSYLYDIIRYDYHFGRDCSEFVFSEIISWIDNNPINCGPNYRCSQEISLRILNWTFALYYYTNCTSLTEEIFSRIQFAIFWQMDHVYKNIDFSRIAVRNNHAITETLAVYLAGLLYPQFPKASKWKHHGKKWFENEIAYQIYEDGTYLQFSMNYHRVVVQLLTWAITLAAKNGETFRPEVYERAKKSVIFLRSCMVDETGNLPNYGANDGALFFKLNDKAYRDYRPSINVLALALKINLGLPECEDALWYGIESKPTDKWVPSYGIHSFEIGGYYIIREKDTLTFIRCGNHKDRPSQADNLHLDVWYKGENILCDAGSYKYNTELDTLKYFIGTASHNTVMIDDLDQMLKGERFIWHYWTKKKYAKIKEEVNSYVFNGEIEGFIFLKKGIYHKREVKKEKEKLIWVITDSIINKPSKSEIKQIWHLPIQHTPVKLSSTDQKGNVLKLQNFRAFTSDFYGRKEEAEGCFFNTSSNVFSTIFQILTD